MTPSLSCIVYINLWLCHLVLVQGGDVTVISIIHEYKATYSTGAHDIVQVLFKQEKILFLPPSFGGLGKEVPTLPLDEFVKKTYSLHACMASTTYHKTYNCSIPQILRVHACDEHYT